VWMPLPRKSKYKKHSLVQRTAVDRLPTKTMALVWQLAKSKVCIHCNNGQ
jgi:hypothetical protein